VRLQPGKTFITTLDIEIASYYRPFFFLPPDFLRGEQTTETIIGSLKETGGHTYDMIYDLFFTTERVIAVSIRHPVDIPPSVSWQTFIFGNWLGRKSDQYEQDKLAEERRNQSQHLTPVELLAQNPRNFAIPYDIITSVEIPHRLFQWQLKFHVSHPESVKRTQFALHEIQVPEARRITALVLPAKLK
jgi:hypothetical protein